MQPIRVLHVVTYMGRGGLETMLMNYYRHIDRSKVQFDFLVHRVFEADYDKEIFSLGGRIYHVSRLIPWSLKYKRELKQFFKGHPEYKIVHVHQDCLSSVALKCAKECGVPIRIAHSHAASQDKNIKYLIKLYYMRMIPDYATHLFACSKAAGDWMFSGHPYLLVRNAIDAELYDYSESKADTIRKKFGLTDEVVIGHVERFQPPKNHLFLIDVFREIHALNKNAKLILVGDGNDMDKVKEYVSRLNLDNYVIFTGARNDVNDILCAMDVFVLPSLYEGLGIGAVEAQACGLPCVVSDGLPEDCRATKDLLTWKKLSDSPETWAECILFQVGRNRVSHRAEIESYGYDIKTAVKKLESFYLQVVKDV